MLDIEVIGVVTDKLISLLKFTPAEDRNIYIGQTNIIHMKANHPGDYIKYGLEISRIIMEPDYVRFVKKDGSIEYVKEFKQNSDYVKVAVRLSGGEKYYARTLYILNSNRVENFIRTGELIPY